MKPLAQDLENEPEFPYLRRKQAFGIRRRSFRRRLLWIFLTALALPIAGMAAYTFSRFALTSPLFTLTSVDIVLAEGNQFVSRDELVAALGYGRGAGRVRGVSIFRVALDDMRKRVEAIPWVQTAYVTRSFPHSLRVQVQERSPIAFVKIGGQVKLIDAAGVLLDKPARGTFDFPVVTGLDAVTTARDRASRLALSAEFEKQTSEEAARSGLPASAGWMISEVDLSDPDDLKAVLVQGQETVQAHFGHSEFSERYRNFLALWPEVRRTVGRVDSIDLRYQRQIVVNPETPPRAVEGEGAPNGAGSGAPKAGPALM